MKAKLVLHSEIIQLHTPHTLNCCMAVWRDTFKTNEGLTETHFKIQKNMHSSVVDHLILIISSFFRTVRSAEIIPFCFHRHVLHFIGAWLMLDLIGYWSTQQSSFKAIWAKNCLSLSHQVF